MEPHSKKNSRRKKRVNLILTCAVLILAFISAACAGMYYKSAIRVFDKITASDTDEVESEQHITATDKTIVMLMGVDQREDDVGRSDTLMVMTIDPIKDKAALLSIPRDTRVKIKGHGYDKINHAYAYGGYKLTQNTIENLLNVNIDHYMIIYTHAFPRIIDAIGGIDIDVEKRMYYEDPWDDDGGLVIDLQKGLQHMDGETAITYVRYRDDEGDIGRIKRQQKFIQAVIDKITSPMIITSLPSVIKEVFNTVDTDLTLTQMIGFAFSLNDAYKNGFQTDLVPGDPVYIDGVSYWIPDIKKLRYTVADILDVRLSPNNVRDLEEYDVEYSRESQSSSQISTDERKHDYSTESKTSSNSKYSTIKNYTEERKDTKHVDDDITPNSDKEEDTIIIDSEPSTSDTKEKPPAYLREAPLKNGLPPEVGNTKGKTPQE